VRETPSRSGWEGASLGAAAVVVGAVVPNGDAASAGESEGDCFLSTDSRSSQNKGLSVTVVCPAAGVRTILRN
jgi:hypothetical protein